MAHIEDTLWSVEDQVPGAVRARTALTPEQQRIVEFGDGPVVVIAGAGTGKTRVIVERVRWLLETHGAPAPTATSGPADTALLPEQILVLTYNVKAARELGERLEAALGPATKARLAVSNFHSFCHRVLADNAGEAGLRRDPDVLDGVGQVLLLHDIRPSLDLVYHSGKSNPNWWLPNFVGFISRAKDELVTPDDVDAFVAREKAAFEVEHGPIEIAFDRLRALGSIDQLKPMMRTYGMQRRAERSIEAHEGQQTLGLTEPELEVLEKAADPEWLQTTAEREARRAVAGTGRAEARWSLNEAQKAAADALAPTYVVDGAALEVLRWSEIALVYRAYQAELTKRAALDFGEQIAAVIGLFRHRPNVLRRYQRQFRYLLVDEFQDANVAQIELLEMIARCPDRQANIMVVGDDDQSIYRFRGASYAAFAEFETRFNRPPAHDPEAPAPGPPPVLRLEEDFRSTERVLLAANRLISVNTTLGRSCRRRSCCRAAARSIGPSDGHDGWLGRRHRWPSRLPRSAVGSRSTPVTEADRDRLPAQGRGVGPIGRRRAGQERSSPRLLSNPALAPSRSPRSRSRPDRGSRQGASQGDRWIGATNAAPSVLIAGGYASSADSIGCV